jgi:gamma-glutamylcyclotransferase
LFIKPAMSTIHYLAYGSNLHPLRLTRRVSSARVIDVVEMPGYRIAFHKRSVDDSGKCLIYAERGQHHVAYGVLYEFDARDKASLDAAEGKGNGYFEQLVQFLRKGKTYAPYRYAARPTHIDPKLVPYHWYKELVLAGARYHRFAPEYIASIEAMPSKPDPDPRRAQENATLLSEMEQV